MNWGGGNPRREHLKLIRTLNLHIMGDASTLKMGFNCKGVSQHKS
jgi:hypothetical protein